MKPLFFETIKVRDGIFHNLKLHAERMKRTIEFFFPDCAPPELDSLAVSKVLSKGLYRCRVTYSDTIKSVEYEPYQKKGIRSLGLVYVTDIDYSWKYCDRALLADLAASSGFDEVILVKNGFVTDSTFSNLVFHNSDGLFTPSTYLLNGTKRQELISLGILTEARISVEDITQFSHLTFINAMLDLSDGHHFKIISGSAIEPVFQNCSPEERL